ncbi:type II toxin-antitoxin system prevent-host-death family antitoxin [Allosaccharopolyspora coralli]|uniref:Type II toxin-antitoxin system prevent-host-death family antitoxin n=1 Tax=Allosaccharopolyspora coralli TaxID=2665642 RepID=A0A5Q3QCS5_9PSEU|nr:type II toxin-antitoxin system prevent-host-death family antitoxin [Allosaccharopolyspora coralli]QGK69275.1 type II toxin-antitoxin system prevent-host-death family antitoxin [Allosaccharopolyspora coralli]
MREEPVRALNQETSRILARVKRGEQIDITERGTVIGRIVPVEPGPLSDLVTSGRMHPATRRGPFPAPRGPVRTDHEAGELMRSMRDGERD